MVSAGLIGSSSDLVIFDCRLILQAAPQVGKLVVLLSSLGLDDTADKFEVRVGVWSGIRAKDQYQLAVAVSQEVASSC